MFLDLRHAFRTLFQSPAYALTCIAVLALGIGANTAIFSVVHSVILPSLPYSRGRDLRDDTSHAKTSRAGLGSAKGKTGKEVQSDDSDEGWTVAAWIAPSRCAKSSGG